MSENTNKLNICVCLSGAIKYPESSKETIAKWREKHNVYVVAHTWKVLDESRFNFNSWSGKHIHPEDMEQFIVDNYKPDFYEIETFEDYIIQFEQLKGSIPNLHTHLRPRNDIGVVSMYYSMFKSNELRKKIDNIDFSVRARFDSYAVCVDFDIYDKSKLIIPNECDFTGINDQFAFGNPLLVDEYCKVYPKFSEILNHHRIYHPETMMRVNLELAGIQGDICRPDIRVRINGER